MKSPPMFDEINALVGAVSLALDMSEIEVMIAIEAGRLTMEMITDEAGENCVLAACDGREARIAQGAIFRKGP